MQTLVGAWFWYVLIDILDLFYMHSLMDMVFQLHLCLIGQYAVQLISLLSSMVFGLHDAGHLIIEISPMCQSISGLCSMSHICPRITIIQPMLVT